MEPLLLIKPISAFKHENVLYIESFLTIGIFIYCYWQCTRQKNVSQTDLCRGAIPIVWSVAANLHYYYHHNAINMRLIRITLLISIWGVRMVYYVQHKLTKRGKFQQDERWSVLYTFIYHPKRPYIWELFVFFVVNLLQIASWSLMVNMPLYLVYSQPQSTSYWKDSICMALFLVFFALEVVADNEMLEFRVVKFKEMMGGHFASPRGWKSDLIDERESVFFGWKYDFLSWGLRKYCLYPNYFGEMGLWLCVLIFGAGNREICWVSILGLVGYLSLCLKLYKLAKITEGIITYKYASYWRYHETVWTFFPWFPKEINVDESVSRATDKATEDKFFVQNGSEHGGWIN